MIKEINLSKGTINLSLVNPRKVFINALKNNGVNIILLHNHPSGDPSPSKEDIMITKRIKESGNIIGVTLIDHIIIGDNIYTSFGENGLL